MVLSVQDHSLHPPKTWVKLWVKPMRQSSKSPVYQGFSALQVEEVRPQSRSSRTSVQQALSSLFIKDFRPMAVMAVMGLFLSLQRRRKPPAELVRGKSLRYRKRLLCYNESRSGNRSKSKGGEPFMANDNGSLSHTSIGGRWYIGKSRQI